MAVFSKICVLGLAGQAVVALPKPVPVDTSQISPEQVDQFLEKAGKKTGWPSDRNVEILEWNTGDNAADTSSGEKEKRDEEDEISGFPWNLKDLISNVADGARAHSGDLQAEAEAKAASESAGTDERLTLSKFLYQNDTNTNDTRPVGMVSFVASSPDEVAEFVALTEDSSSSSKRNVVEEHLLGDAPTEFAAEDVVAFTTGYTSTQSTFYNTQPTAVAADAADAAKVEEALNVPTQPAVNETLSSETFSAEEQVEFGAAPLKEQEKKSKKKGTVTESSTEEEEQKEDEGSSSKDEKKNDKKNYGAVEKRGQYDQQWADYYNKAGAYEGADYDVYEYLKEYEQTLPEHLHPSENPPQEPQPEPQPEFEEKPVFIHAPEEPKAQQDAPIIIPAPQSPPQEPEETIPGEQIPDPVQAGQPGEEQLQDFVMFVPKDQSGGAKPYMVPANEYNPDTPPQRLPAGVKPPPINLGGRPDQKGSEPGKGQEAISVPLPDAPAGAEYEYVPVGPAGGPLSDGSHPLPDWFPTRPGPGHVEKRGEVEERSCGGHPHGREFESSPSHGCNGCADDPRPFRPGFQDVETSLSALAKRGLKSKLSKSAAPKFDFDNEENVFKPYVPPPPPYQGPPPPPPSPKAPSHKGLLKSKPIKFDMDFDDDDDDDDDYQGSPLPPSQGSMSKSSIRL